MAPKAINLDRLSRQQAKGLWLRDRKAIKTAREAARFLKEVGFALRYDSAEGLPLASMYRAAWGKGPPMSGRTVEAPARGRGWDEAQRRAIELTNVLLAKRTAVEVNIIADRLVVVHRSVVPALYALRRRGRKPDDLEGLTIEAVRAYDFIRRKKTATAGEVSAHLGVEKNVFPNPALYALEELQRYLLIDRGASNVPKEGIPYLSKEGYPYRIFHGAHKDLVKAAAGVALEKEGATLILAYLKAAVFIPLRKLAWLFKLCLTENELRMVLAGLVKRKKAEIRLVGKTEIILAR